MPKKFSDYIYRNSDDSVRVRIFRRDSGRWDYDVCNKRTSNLKTYSDEAGDDFPTKAKALAEAKRLYKGLRSINPKDNWIED